MTSVPIPGTAAVHPADAVHLGPVPDETRLEVTLVLNPKAPGHELRHKQEEIERLAPLSRPRLSDAERGELDGLRDCYGKTTLRKARALALLSVRSGKGLLAQAA